MKPFRRSTVSSKTMSCLACPSTVCAPVIGNFFSFLDMDGNSRQCLDVFANECTPYNNVQRYCIHRIPSSAWATYSGCACEPDISESHLSASASRHRRCSKEAVASN